MRAGDNSGEKQAAGTLETVLRNMAAKLSLQKVFSIAFVFQFMVLFGLIAGICVYGGQQAVNAVLKEMQREVLERVYEQLSRYMEEPVKLNRLNVDAWRVGILDLADTTARERYFTSHIRAFPGAAMTFAGLHDGAFYGARRKATGEIQVVRNNRETGGDSWYYSVSPQGDAVDREEIFQRFDARTRPWYEGAAKLGRPTFSGVYRHFVFHEPTVTAAHPVFDAGGKVVGVFGVDYLLSWVGDVLREIPVGTSGQIFITDAEGLLVATSTSNALFVEKDGQVSRVQASEARNPVLRTAVQSLASESGGESREIEYDNRSFLVGVKGFQASGINWNIYVVLANDDFLGDMKRTVTWTVVITILAVIGASFMAVWTAGWIARPILRLNSAAHELAEGRLQAVPDTDRQDELGQLARSFNAMAQQITGLVEGLEQKVAERTKALEEITEREQKLRESLHAELMKAGKEQRSMLPPDIEQERLALRIIYEPSMHVSGDFCGYHWLEKGDILFGYIIDVTGHGAATALQAAAINVMIQENLHAGFSLAEGMVELNKRIGSYLRDDTMVAACCFQLDFKRRELSYIAAGITEFFISSALVKGRLKTFGSFLGLSDQPEFEVLTMPIAAGDIICFYSDGIADQFVEAGSLPVNAAFDEVVEGVRNAAGIGVLRDDCTAMCIKITM